MLLLLAEMVFVWVIHVFLQLSRIVYLEQHETFSIVNTMIFRKYSFQKLTQFSQVNNVLDLLLITFILSFWEIHVFLQVSWIDLIGANKDYLHLKHLSCRKYSFQKLTEFSQKNNVLDAPASKTHSCFWRDICVLFHLSWLGLLETKTAYDHLEKPTLQMYFF
jgi:hypothetical protein